MLKNLKMKITTHGGLLVEINMIQIAKSVCEVLHWNVAHWHSSKPKSRDIVFELVLGSKVLGIPRTRAL